ncbi:MAG: hypothetical protein IJL47_00225 [Lachnospiraceae bacterium]|nr:hypothetical protein [Lachnospiraceae bacterium]
MKNKTARLYTRVTPAELMKIRSLAKRCGLSVSEYIRQRALGFAPREIQPEIFHELIRRIETLYGETRSKAVSEEILSLVKDIRVELILPGNDKEVRRWPPLDSGPLKGN